MARMRTIKPGFFRNEALADASIPARLLGIALLTIADREGRLLDSPRAIKLDSMPWDDVDVEVLLAELARVGFILRYQMDGGRYIQVLKFKRHQAPHIKEAPSTIPAPTQDGAGPGPGRGEHPQIMGSGIQDGIQDQGSGEGDRDTHAGAPAREPSPSADSLRSPGELAPLRQDPEEVSRDGEAGTVDEEQLGAAGETVEAFGWTFTPADVEVLVAASADLAVEPLELPLAISTRLTKRAQQPAGTKGHLPARIVEAWNAMSGSTVAAWCAAALQLARRKKGTELTGLLDLAAGMVATDLEVGADLLVTSKGRASMGVAGPTPPRPAGTAKSDAEVAAVKEAIAADPEGEKRKADLGLAAMAVRLHGPASPQAVAAAEKYGLQLADVVAFVEASKAAANG
jgi:hypothetical protein